MVQGLFQGHLSHVTTCHTCRRPSEGSKREVEFYELSLQVQGMPSLHTSLVSGNRLGCWLSISCMAVACADGQDTLRLVIIVGRLPRANVLRCATGHAVLAVPPSPLLQVAALAPDELVGDNQYFCDFCAAKSDADRRMRLRSLPPYLCLALQRFTYDHQVRAALCARAGYESYCHALTHPTFVFEAMAAAAAAGERSSNES